MTEMQQDFPQRKQAYDAELGELDQQIQSLNNLLGRCARRPSQLLLQLLAFASTLTKLRPSHKQQMDSWHSVVGVVYSGPVSCTDRSAWLVTVPVCVSRDCVVQ